MSRLYFPGKPRLYQDKTYTELKRPIRVLGFFFSILSWPILLTTIQAMNNGDYEIQATATLLGLCWFNIGALFIFLDYIFYKPNP